MPRDASLSDSYTSYRCCFSSMLKVEHDTLRLFLVILDNAYRHFEHPLCNSRNNTRSVRNNTRSAVVVFYDRIIQQLMLSFNTAREDI